MKQPEMLLQVIVYKKEQAGYPYIQQAFCNSYADICYGMVQVKNRLFVLPGNKELQCHKNQKERHCQCKQIQFHNL